MFDPSPKQKHLQDQILAAWQDSIPPMMKSIFDGFIKAGFTPDQALDLTKFIWMFTQSKLPPRNTEEE